VINKTPFITFEGGEGAGKTTQIKLLKQWLEEQGKSVITTREPGGTPGAEDIRNLIVLHRDYQWDAETDTLLFMAARRDHLVHKIWPAMEQGQWVISDRFVESTYAYQCFGRGMELKKAQDMYALISDGFVQDITFIFDIDPRVGLDRVLAGADRNQAETRFENYDFSFHEKLRAGYHELAKQEPHRFVIIDASTDRETVQNHLRAEIQKRFMA
jgi:dTMP kinase